MIQTLFGFLAALITTIQYIPQVLKAIKTKKVKDLSKTTFSLSAIGSSCWIIYGINLNKDWTIITANTFTLLCALTILYLKIPKRKQKH